MSKMSPKSDETDSRAASRYSNRREMSDIEPLVRLYHNESRKDEHHRYRSWEHCYQHFCQLRRIPDGDRDIDHAALHLGFFLASWGMYRGSCPLLKKDYKVHTDAVRVLLRREYDALLHVDFDSQGKTEAALPALFALRGALRNAYAGRAGVKASKVTDTLVTKVILGTCGCTPAYDRYFVKGLRENGLRFSKFNGDSFAAVCRFYRDNAVAFRRVGRQIAPKGVQYPIMKLVDMYFWQVGLLAETRT